MTTLDVLIAIPVIPYLALVVTWWFPWELWIPWGKLPKLLLGPYILYGAFAAWHFHLGRWIVLLAFVAGAVLTIVGAVENPPKALLSTSDKIFLKTLESWLQSQSEIMIVVQYSRAAGNKSFEFYTSYVVLRQRLESLKAETSVAALREPQLPLRGRVDDEFIGKCLSIVAPGSEFLVLETDPRMAAQQWMYRYEDGESIDELKQALKELRGRLVAVGEYPQWMKTSPDVISAYVPHQDGTVKAGVY